MQGLYYREADLFRERERIVLMTYLTITLTIITIADEVCWVSRVSILIICRDTHTHTYTHTERRNHGSPRLRETEIQADV